MNLQRLPRCWHKMNMPLTDGEMIPYPLQTHLTTQISGKFVIYNLYNIYQVVLKFRTKRRRLIVLLCATFEHDLTIEMGVKGENLARFEFKISCWRISNRAMGPRWPFLMQCCDSMMWHNWILILLSLRGLCNCWICNRIKFGKILTYRFWTRFYFIMDKVFDPCKIWDLLINENLSAIWFDVLQ